MLILSILQRNADNPSISPIANAKEHLGDQPLTDEIAKQVGEPKYADELTKLDKARDTTPPAEEKSFGDKAREVVGEVAESAIKGVLGISEAHAGTMDLSYLHEDKQQNQHDSGMAKQTENTQNQADKDSSGSLNGDKQTQPPLKDNGEQKQSAVDNAQTEQHATEQRQPEKAEQTQTDEQVDKERSNEQARAEEQRRLAEQKAEEQRKAEEQARLEREKAEEAERKKKEEENNKKAKNSTLTTDKDGKNHISMKSFKKPFDKLPDNAPSWLKVANGQMGITEINDKKVKPGQIKDEPEVLKYLATTTLPKNLKAKDETAWCSAFVNWVLAQDNIKGTRSAGSQSWVNTNTWDGQKLDKPAYGSIAIIRHPNGQGHVGFVAGIDEKTGDLLILGGNQGNMVKLTPQKSFLKEGSKIVGYVHPSGHTPDYNIPTISSATAIKGKTNNAPQRESDR